LPPIYLHRHVVRAEEIDPLGHVNNVAYVQWMQDAAIAHSSVQGWPMARYRSELRPLVNQSRFEPGWRISSE
jgi:acyl-CoA thioester hydrolase